MKLSEIIDQLTHVRWELGEHRKFMELFPKGQWLIEHYARCARCATKRLYVVALRKPDMGGRSPVVLEEIVDGYCTNCASDELWFSLLALEEERDIHGGLPQKKRDELCSHCLSSEVTGIWRGLNPTCAECENCGALELPRTFIKRHRRSRALLRLKRIKLRAEERRLVALYLEKEKLVLKDPFPPSP